VCDNCFRSLGGTVPDRAAAATPSGGGGAATSGFGGGGGGVGGSRTSDSPKSGGIFSSLTTAVASVLSPRNASSPPGASPAVADTWFQTKAEDGTPYFFNERTGETVCVTVVA
jgi:hypothetical protein